MYVSLDELWIEFSSTWILWPFSLLTLFLSHSLYLSVQCVFINLYLFKRTSYTQIPKESLHTVYSVSWAFTTIVFVDIVELSGMLSLLRHSTFRSYCPGRIKLFVSCFRMDRRRRRIFRKYILFISFCVIDVFYFLFLCSIVLYSSFSNEKVLYLICNAAGLNRLG